MKELSFYLCSIIIEFTQIVCCRVHKTLPGERETHTPVLQANQLDHTSYCIRFDLYLIIPICCLLASASWFYLVF